MRFSFHLASGPNEKKKTQTPIVRFLQETQRVFSFHLAPRSIFFFFFSFFFHFFLNLFTFFFKCARRMGKNHRKDGDPYPAQKKVCFLLNLPSTSTHTHTHTHTESTDTETQHHTESTDTHRHKEGRRKEEARKGKEQPKKCC